MKKHTNNITMPAEIVFIKTDNLKEYSDCFKSKFHFEREYNWPLRSIVIDSTSRQIFFISDKEIISHYKQCWITYADHV